MSNYLKTYKVTLQTKGPVFVGDGKEIGKKEYVFLANSTIGILDIQKLYLLLKNKGKDAYFEDYILRNNRDNLNTWLLDQRTSIADVKPAIKYEIQSCDHIDKRARGLQVMSFIKDPYGNPYIPGSSLKGLFRTILLAAEIIGDHNKYNTYRDSIRSIAASRNEQIGRTHFLRADTEKIETVAFRTMERPDTKPGDAVNDIMQGFIVSDSSPLSLRDLVLCQKIDVHKDGTEKSLPLLRECIKPGVEICFTLTIDSKTCGYDADRIMEGVRTFINQYYEHYLIKFNQDRPAENTIYVGGGAGFLSKTIIYPLFGKEGVDIATNIFFKTGVGVRHKHDQDRKLNVSPHVLKCTHYDSKLYRFGECELSIKALS